MRRVLKENMDKEIKEFRETMCKKVGNINRKIKILKSTRAKIKISGRFGGIFEQAKERIKKT